MKGRLKLHYFVLIGQVKKKKRFTKFVNTVQETPSLESLGKISYSWDNLYAEAFGDVY